jgi:hypothetical protein
VTPTRRLLLFAGWALLVLGPAAGALFLVRPVDETAVVYGATPPSRALGALEGGAPAALAAAVLFFVVAGRVRRSGVRLVGRDERLVAASEAAGWALAGVVGLAAALLVLLVGGPLGIIGVFAVTIVGFSLLRRRPRGGG